MAYIIGSLVGGLLLFIATAPVALVAGIANAMRKANQLRQKDKADTEVEERMEDTSKATKAQETAKANYRRHIDLGYAQVDVWFYPEDGLAKRTIRLKDEKLIEQLGVGVKLKLPDVKCVVDSDEDDVVTRTLDEVKTTLGKSGAADEPSVIDRKPPRTKPERETPERKVRTEATYTGEIIRFGLEERDGREGKYETYALHLFDSSVGAPHQLFGVDLERAIKEAKVNPGDRVEVIKHGRTRVGLGEGKAGYKNLWSVKQI